MKKQDNHDVGEISFPKTGKPVPLELMPLIDFLAEQAAREFYGTEEQGGAKSAEAETPVDLSVGRPDFG